MNEPKAQG
jgi:hypothetical protein